MADSATPGPGEAIDTVVLDLDGTLVDSVYVHVLAWQAAFRDVGITASGVRLHRAIGMGGDRLVTAVAGEQAESAVGDEVRARHPEHLDRLFGSITPTRGASDLLDELRAHRIDVVLASSGDRDLTSRLLGLIDAADLLQETVTGSDARSSKPSGELIEVALDSVDVGRSVVVGDAVWDVRSARDAGVPCIGLLCGGISEAELRDAGAVAVFDDPASLAEHLAAHGSLLATGGS